MHCSSVCWFSIEVITLCCSCIPTDFDFFVGIMNKIAIDIARVITPPSLFGIDRRIAYENRNYHSGWMCTGVTKGFAGVKLSGSLNLYGSFRVTTVSIIVGRVAQSV